MIWSQVHGSFGGAFLAVNDRYPVQFVGLVIQVMIGRIAEDDEILLIKGVSSRSLQVYILRRQVSKEKIIVNVHSFLFFHKDIQFSLSLNQYQENSQIKQENNADERHYNGIK